MSTAKQREAAQVRSRALFYAAALVVPRRPLSDDEPWYVESDKDWVENNFDAVVAFLEAATAEENTDSAATCQHNASGEP